MANMEHSWMSAAAQTGQPKPEFQRPRWGWWLSGTGIVMVIIIAGSMLSPYIRHQLALSLFRQAAPYTELAFSNAAALPVTAVRGKEMHISFVITNAEDKSVTYQYVVASGSGAKLKWLNSSSVTVASGATWRVNTSILPKCAATVCRVQVSLPRQDERIDFIFKEKSIA